MSVLPPGRQVCICSPVLPDELMGWWWRQGPETNFKGHGGQGKARCRASQGRVSCPRSRPHHQLKHLGQ